MDLSIVLLNYKGKGLVRQCIKGIIAAQPQLDYEIIVVDNDSGDGCLEMVETLLNPPPKKRQPLLPLENEPKLPPYQCIQSEKNIGFAAGNNLGIKAAKGKYILVMNSDVSITPNSLEHMVEFMDLNPKCGIAGPKLINPDGSIQYSARRFPNILMPLYRRTFLGKLPFAKRSLKKYLMEDWDHDQSQEVDWLFGAYLILRRELIEQVGMFDERFFVYFEDLDLCRRAWEKGFGVWYVPSVELVHYHQRESAGSPVLLSIFKPITRIHLMSAVKYFAKYLGVKLPR